MALRYAQEPLNGSKTVNDSLRRFSSFLANKVPELADLASLQLGPPHAVYNLRIDEIAQGTALGAAQLSSHRYLVSAFGKPLAAVEVSMRQGVMRMANLNIGRFVNASAKGLENLAVNDQIRSGTYEACLLRCLPLYFLAIWLKSDDGDDYVFPLGPALAGTESGKLHPADDFFAIIQPVAQQKIAAALNKPRSPGDRRKPPKS